MSKQQPEQEKPKASGVGLGQKVANKVIESVRVIADYAVENLPRLIVDADSDPPMIVWPEAFEMLRKIINDPASPTRDEICTVLEALAPGFKFDMLDNMIKNLSDWKVKIAIGVGLASARTILKVEPDWIAELNSQRETLVLKMLNHESTISSYQLLEHRPRLTKFITDYTLMKVGIQTKSEGVKITAKPVELKGPVAGVA